MINIESEQQLFEMIEAKRTDKGMTKIKLCETAGFSRMAWHYYTTGERKLMWDTLFSAAGVVGIQVYVHGEDTDD
jgi:transcriptional regulator with XRE-family HTH domain